METATKENTTPIYCMTSYRSQEIGYWGQCRATTLTGAKREARRMYGDGWMDATLKISVWDNIYSVHKIVSVCRNIGGSKWHDVE